MGNNNGSNIHSECVIDDCPILKCHSWTLHHAHRDREQLSVFVSPADDCKNSLELLGQNLKLYRHPNILRYVGSCTDQDVHYLYTEKVSPLSAVLKQQSALQTCLGLNNIVQSVEFLHRVGKCCHNNVAQSSIFVSPDGNWKLAGMEFVTKFEHVSQSVLESTHSRRYDKAICPEEKMAGQVFKHHEARDVFSLGVLVQEVLCVVDSQGVPGATDFLEFAKKRMKAQDPDLRPNLEEILQHGYFVQDYLDIFQFLTQLALKSPVQKATFFGGLTERLHGLPEKTIGTQLTPLLLSRLVLLDEAAVQHFIPNMLTPSEGERQPYSSERVANPILSRESFKVHVVPLLLNIFQVRDVQVRSVLLSHFSSFCGAFSASQLEEDVLPQLLLGIRDNNDQMVASTLRALADLVPLLGASTVIGMNRRKIFSDGSPGKAFATSHRPDSTTTPRNVKKSVSATPPDTERHSPIGAEHSDHEAAVLFVEDADGWDEWEEQSLEVTTKEEEVEKCEKTKEDPKMADEPDFFVDMEPVIAKAFVAPSKTKFDALAVIEDVEQVGDGWDPEEAEGWDDL